MGALDSQKMASCRCRRNVYVLACAFMCNFTSYMGLEVLQSSLNRSTGTTALCLFYATLVPTTMFLPPLAITKLDCRKSLFFGMLAYPLFTLANFYPEPFLLIPASVILGIGGSVLWGTGTYYLMQLAERHAKETKKNVVEVTSDFFGRFYAIYSFSFLVSTLIMTVVFEFDESSKNVSPDSTLVVDWDSESIAAPTSTTEDSTVNKSEITCGLHYKISQPEGETEQLISDVTRYIVLSIFLAFNLVATVLCLCIDDISGSESGDQISQDGTSVSLTSGDQMEGCAVNDNEVEMTSKQKNLKIHQNRSSAELVKSTVKLLLTDKTAILLCPLTLNFGTLKAFLASAYNASWITCTLGIKYMVSISCVSGVVYIIGCYVFGRLPKYTTHAKIFLCTMTLEAVLFVITIVWQPSGQASEDAWIFFVIRSLFSICQCSLNSQLGSIYSRFYADNKKAGSALVWLWSFAGSATIFGISGFLFPFQVLAVNFVICVVGTVMYLTAEKIQNKSYRKCEACFPGL